MAKILLIDDDAAIRRTVGRMLRRGGHQVIEARDGAEGLREFRTQRPEIVISDIYMPETEGSKRSSSCVARTLRYRSSLYRAVILYPSAISISLKSLGPMRH
jgi:CheY-like chemotaxis protein